MTQDNRQAKPLDSGRVDVRLARDGGLSFLEIPAIDTRRSAVFYEKVLGWKVQNVDADHPKFMDKTGHLIGQWRKDRAASREPGLLPYIYVDLINEAVARVAPNGGEVIKAPYPEGNLWVATIRDPAGNVIGLWQEAPRG